jgi:hypothetical protein
MVAPYTSYAAAELIQICPGAIGVPTNSKATKTIASRAKSSGATCIGRWGWSACTAGPSFPLLPDSSSTSGEYTIANMSFPAGSARKSEARNRKHCGYISASYNSAMLKDTDKLVDHLARASSTAVMLAQTLQTASRHVIYRDDGIAADFIDRAEHVVQQLQNELKEINNNVDFVQYE